MMAEQLFFLAKPLMTFFLFCDLSGHQFIESSQSLTLFLIHAVWYLNH